MINTRGHSAERSSRLGPVFFACRLAWAVAGWLAFTVINLQAGPLVSADSPIGFFTNVANRLLQSQLGLSLNHIQLYPTNQYTPSVHRLLQVTANLYDATTNRPATDYPYLPSVFRPVFTNETGAGGSQIYICGFEEVTKTSVLSQRMMDLSDPDGRANLQPYDMVCGIPLVIGAKKGFPNFNEFAMHSQVQVVRKLQFHRPGTSTTMPVNEIDQMFVMGISNVLGVEAWNSYSTPFPRDLQLLVWPDITVIVTNLETGRLLRISRFQPAVATNIPAASWGGYNPVSPQYSFQVPLLTNLVFLSNMTYQAASDSFVPLTSQFERWGGTNFYVPNWKLTMRTRLRFAVVDTAANRIVDYVNLAADTATNIMDALTYGGVCGGPYTPNGSIGSMWCTNRLYGAQARLRPDVWNPESDRSQHGAHNR